MEDYRNDRKEQEIVCSKSVKAGKRIYYLDVKKSRNNDLFLAITESKKKFGDDDAVSFEKHKIFLYKEDFEKFTEALQEMVAFINEANEANGSRDIREFRSHREHRDYYNDDEQHGGVSAGSEETQRQSVASKYDVDVDFEI